MAGGDRRCLTGGSVTMVAAVVSLPAAALLAPFFRETSHTTYTVVEESTNLI